MKALATVVAISSLTACASFSTMKTARAIDPGTSQFSVIGSAVGVTLPNANADGDGITRTALGPQFELQARYGIFDGFDLGAKLTSLGGELNSTISLVRSNVFDLALAPAVGVTGYTFSPCASCDNTNVWEIYGKLALLFGIRMGPGREHELVFGPEVVPVGIVAGDEQTGAQANSQSTWLVGGVAGISFKVSPWLRIMPEVTVLTPVTNFFLGPDAPLLNRFGENNAIFYQVGLGFSWGNDGFGRPRYARPPPPDYPPPGYPPPQYYPQQRYYAPPPTYPPQPNYVPPPPPPPPPPQGERTDT